jgi:hypothetical protein
MMMIAGAHFNDEFLVVVNLIILLIYGALEYPLFVIVTKIMNTAVKGCKTVKPSHITLQDYTRLYENVHDFYSHDSFHFN